MFKNKWNIVLAVEGIVLALLLIYAVRLDTPCVLSFEVREGFNFDQPYPIYRGCSGSEPVDINRGYIR